MADEGWATGQTGPTDLAGTAQQHGTGSQPAVPPQAGPPPGYPRYPGSPTGTAQQPTVPQAVPPGRVIANRYRLHGELGRGGMGVVWRGEDQVIGRPVAVKEMRLDPEIGPAQRAELEARILREARSAGRLNDPAVVTVFDVVHDNGSVYIVMELVEAQTMAQLVRAAGPLPPSAVARAGLQVLAALEAAHSAGIVHRDVKPSNIMMLPNGRAKLTDFGIAQAVDDPTLTMTGTVVGSPAYLAPERLSGREATPSSDVWSLGAVLFFAVEGRGAFERETTAATLSAVIHEVPYLTRAQGPLAAAISGMLTAAPEGRLGGAQLRGLLEAAAQEDGGFLGVTRPLAAGVNGPTTALTGPQPAGPGEPGAPARSRGRSLGRLAGVGFGIAILVGGAGYAVGSTHGKRIQKTADQPPYAQVTLLTYGLPGEAGTLEYGLASNDCGSGSVPMRAGNNYSTDVQCTQPHDYERYWEVPLGGDKAPYPDPVRLGVAAQAVCYAAASKARPIDGAQYAALVPSQALWEGRKLPDGWSADHDVICVQWRNAVQIPPSPTPAASTSGG